MFEKSCDDLEKLGARNTTTEIMQEPALWRETVRIYRENKTAIEAFLAEAAAMADGRTTVVLAGAGSSDYVSDTVAPYLRRCGDTDTFDFKPIATTDLVSAPLDFIRPADPTIVVSFARSGNSPESLAAVRVLGKLIDNVRFLNITCAPDGRLKTEFDGDPHALTILLPGANDKGFAMTGSYTCMQLLCALIFDTSDIEKKAAWVEAAADMGEEVISRESEIARYLSGDFNRVTYLGSGGLSGLAQEAQLKILELAHGLVATSWDSAMGYRHGPKSFVDDKTLVFVFVSNDPYTRQYDLDILNEISGDDIAQRTVAVQQDAGTVFEHESFTFQGREPLPEAYLSLPFAMVAQTIGVLNSVRVGNTPDTPNPTGTVNRVVKGVTIHPWEA
ncbi:galactosamine 6-phosphate isomerase AgaS [Coriobacterium glomerans PW2]|uniref:Galactosamine 6-phosphate isomerase AgaS n=1 Tax=Coriobacterium glomerans (strain ATCC 49209 / DSM 20642 / JCM 10262 / PW2) TaxID=700015 RepID=F2NAK0_CORGP|nr:SIS domain-containing protein [Coriobacterium glomerans]AEB06527.1 galactosamine 6-phosphate isomerase AgaS [Coriobacterium glomerans PW2]